MNHLEMENQQFRSMINHYLAKLDYQVDCNMKVIDVACGKCREAELLLEMFGNDITWIDNDPEELDSLIQRIGPKKGRFVEKDARKLTKIVDCEADIVFVRHPNISDHCWPKIIKECYKATRPGGLLFSSYYTNMDHAFAKFLLDDSRYDIRFSERNQFGIVYSDRETMQAGVDLFVIIAQKPEKEKFFQSFIHYFF